MLPVHRIPLPAVTDPAPRRGIPVVATIAPLLLAVVLWLVTSSPYTLLFALLGPVVGVATALDGRRSSRRARRAELAAARERMAAVHTEIEALVAARLRECRAALPRLGEASPEARGWWIGAADLPSGIQLETAAEVPELAGETAALRALAAVVPGAPLMLEDTDEIAVTGVRPLVDAFARGLILQAVGRCEPGTARVTAPEGERWIEALPARCAPGAEWTVDAGERRILRIRVGAPRPGEWGLALGEAGEHPRIESPEPPDAWRPAYLAAVEAAHLAARLAEAARAHGWRAPEAIPASVDLEELLTATSDDPISGAPLARDGEGVVSLDLVDQGPHALVAGTTGAGKSELLVSWVIALAARHPPSELAFLLVDFKGGAAFAPLTVLPHVAGIVSDLDPSTAARAVQSLRAELRRRETVLARYAVREARELPAGVVPRLVIVVDEFAALVQTDPELQQVFADLAARGRSLGLHLVLGTQRPAGVVRDAVLANITLRVCLRVLESSDSAATVGVSDAAAIPAAARGRAIVRDGAGVREVQLALAGPGLAARVAARWEGHPIPEARPWVDPLPVLVTRSELPSAPGGEPVVGLVDLPECQRRDPLMLDPWRAGPLLVVGASGSGRTEALASLAAACPAEVRWVPQEPAELWDALVAPVTAQRTLVAIDDLDALLARGDAEQRAELSELLVRVAREGRRAGVAVAASSRAAGGALQGALAAFEQRLLLRLPSREEHLLTGGEARTFRADRRPGSAVWEGHEAQLALAPAHPQPWRSEPVEAHLGEGDWGIASPDPEGWLAELAAAGVHAAALGGDPAAMIVVGDADSWLIDHLTLGRMRRSGRLLLHGCGRGELRTLTRSRGAAPPLAGPGEAWLATAGRVTRVRLVLPALAAPGDASSRTPEERRPPAARPS
ncbi:MAG: hypothetical protein DI534_02285 [Leifsonia xyli]|nr:MAG: hypothetical protein DI534_02285 [Leifsonia xyli]